VFLHIPVSRVGLAEFTGRRGIARPLLRGVEKFSPHHLHSGLLIGSADKEVFAIIGLNRD
jgi:hypothetical protein